MSHFVGRQSALFLILIDFIRTFAQGKAFLSTTQHNFKSMNTIFVRDVVGSDSPILPTEGEKLYDVLNQSFDGKSPVEVSFRGITHCTSAFLNYSIGLFLTQNGGNAVNVIDANPNSVWYKKLNRTLSVYSNRDLTSQINSTLNEVTGIA